VKDTKDVQESLLTSEKEKPVQVLVFPADLENTFNGASSSSERDDERYSAAAVLLLSIVITVTCLIAGLGIMAFLSQPRSDNIADNNVEGSRQNGEGYVEIAIIDISFSTVQVQEVPVPTNDNKVKENIKYPDIPVGNDIDGDEKGGLNDGKIKTGDLFNDFSETDSDNVDDGLDFDDTDMKGLWEFSDENSEEWSKSVEDIPLDNKQAQETNIRVNENSPDSDSYEDPDDFQYKK